VCACISLCCRRACFLFIHVEFLFDDCFDDGRRNNMG